MLNSVLTTVEQVLILFLLIFVGFLCGKFRIFNDESISHLSSFVLHVVAPCAIIDSFYREFDAGMFRAMLIVMLIAVVTYGVNILFSRFLVHDKDVRTQRTLRYGVVFGNCGYMGLPLQQVLFGSDGVFFGASYIMVYNLVCWTYGIYLMSGDKKQLSFRKLLNPGIIGITLGILIFLFSIRLPDILYRPISYLSALNVPVPMVISGYYLSQADLKKLWFHAKYYVTIGIRLIVTPLLAIFALHFLHLDPTLLTCCIIDTAVPVAAATTMFSISYGQDSHTAANIVSVSTLLSIVTLPILVALSQTVFA